MSLKKQINACVLCGVILTLIACGESTGTQVITEKADTTVNEQFTTEAKLEYLSPNVDMGGETYTIMTNGWYDYAPLQVTDVVPEQSNGEVLNDVSYERANKVMEQFNCVLKCVDYGNQDNGTTVLMNAIMAGDSFCDIALIRGKNFKTLTAEGYLQDLADIESMHMDAPYYDSASLALTEIKGHTFGVVSSISTNRYLTISCVFANLKLIDDYSDENIYDIVKEGKWTLEKMFSIGKNHESDYDNNGNYDNKDRYTVTYINNSVPSMIKAAGANFAEISDDGILLTLDQENNLSKVIKVHDYFRDTTKSYYYHVRSTDPADEHNMFLNRQCVFHMGSMCQGTLFRDMEDDFAILPIPKLDEADECRTSNLNDIVPLTVVPITNERTENTGIIIEELSYLGKRDLYPVMYDIVLKEKIARDEQSQMMLDIIFNNTVYDPGLMFTDLLYYSMRAHFGNGDTGFASTLESVKPNFEAEMDDIYTAIE